MHTGEIDILFPAEFVIYAVTTGVFVHKNIAFTAVVGVSQSAFTFSQTSLKTAF